MREADLAAEVANIAADAGRFAIRLWNTDFRRWEKSPGNPVCAVDLDKDDPLVAEWNVVVISPNFAATLTARQVGEPSPSNDSFEFILTHDRRLTIEAARTLVARL